MAGNIFGKILTLKTFGESHGKAIGGILDGLPPGIPFSENELQAEMDRRKPGQSDLTTSRKEEDRVEILSGIQNGMTTGMPVGLLIHNTDARPSDYQTIKKALRPSHADYTYKEKYGLNPVSGGGRASARETAVRVAAGYFAKKLLASVGIDLKAYVFSVGNHSLPDGFSLINQPTAEENVVRCPDRGTAGQIERLIREVKQSGDTVGGTIQCEIFNSPAGLGEPVFDKLHADLAKAMLSINACKGFEYGSGFESAGMTGSQHNDSFFTDDDNKVKTATNFSGGIQGGISNGMPIYFKVAFKPVSTLRLKQSTIDLEGNPTRLSAGGRHDPCVVPRAVPIVEAMAALVMADHLLRSEVYKKIGNKGMNNPSF